MTILLFPGQGCQFPGMGAELLAACPAAEALYATGTEILGYDLKKICMEADAETLAETQYAQPAIFVTSLLCLEAARQRGITFDAVAGHSLGEYAAMVACGMLSVRDGFRALRVRAAAMDLAAKQGNGAMAAILRLDAAEIQKICAETDGYVLPVNYNSAGQTVIAGDGAAVSAASQACVAAGGKAIPLAVASAFHSALMQPAADVIAAEFQSISFAEPMVPFYTNLTGDKLPTGTDMAQYCAKHCVSPVRFTDALQAMARDGADTYLELGPKRVLGSFVKQTLRDVRILHIGDCKTLEEACK